MVRAIPIRILRQILLVIACAEAFPSTEFSNLSRRGHAAGRLSVDVAVDPPVDQTPVRSEQCPRLTEGVNGRFRNQQIAYTTSSGLAYHQSRAAPMMTGRSVSHA